MNKQYNKYSKMIGITILIVLFGYLAVCCLSKITKNGFTTYDLATAGIYPKADNVPLLTDSYQYTGNKHVSNNSYNDIWWHYPIFREGSYEQITNNLRYYKNPDEGTCIRADFCGALYKDKKNKSNLVYPLPPVPNGQGARVNYYRGNPNELLQPDDNKTQPDDSIML